MTGHLDRDEVVQFLGGRFARKFNASGGLERTVRDEIDVVAKYHNFVVSRTAGRFFASHLIDADLGVLL